ncbi:transposase [Peptoanaerobacter stomatis]|uniref:Transposase n=1 Tax=Peptoanaerobacter stomatis TaxID=796937 RepID=J5UI75_9FIRM|nr:transposase [Peptoanaerobacter stomatis]
MKIKRYEENFKKQIVNIYNQGNHTLRQLGQEYKISISTLNKWINRYNNTGSFEINDNRTQEEKELIKLRMENDILKQAALLLGKK